MQDLGKMLLGLGLLLAVIGAAILLAARVGLPLGRLPGDISYKGKNVTFYFPLGTSILISIVLSAILYFVSRLPAVRRRLRWATNANMPPEGGIVWKDDGLSALRRRRQIRWPAARRRWSRSRRVCAS